MKRRARRDDGDDDDMRDDAEFMGMNEDEESNSDNDIDKDIDVINRDVIETSQTKMSKMSIAALAMQKEIMSKQSRLNEISVKNDKLVQENRLIAKELLSTGEEKEKEADKDYESKLERLHGIEEEVETIEQHNSIIRHVLECLITESNVNWVEDNEIRDFILKN